MKTTILTTLFLLFTTTLVLAQRPSLHIKTTMGTNITNYVFKNDVAKERFETGIHGGIGFRMYYRHLLTEIDFHFIRSKVSWLQSETDLNQQNDFLFNSFDIPITAGYIISKNPFGRHSVYGGINSRFLMKGFNDVVEVGNTNPTRRGFKPGQAGLNTAQFMLRLGTQVDVAYFNFDVNYNLGLNKVIRNNERVQSHQLMFAVSVIF